MAISAAMERYLYAILLLKKKYCCVRSVDVAHYLKCTKPSVSVIVNKLIREGLLVMEEDGNLEITNQGNEYIQSRQDRSIYFQQMLEAAGIDPDIAETEAFSLAKAIQPDTFEALKKYLSNAL
ncbi:MAG: metal-dependent transcriptional regulator [Clostridia bacterium]|nr:metal-dependent transcriptional regulator [Clostridia bacterium]